MYRIVKNMDWESNLNSSNAEPFPGKVPAPKKDHHENQLIIKINFIKVTASKDTTWVVLVVF